MRFTQKYDEIAHLAPPKYTDVCRTSISDDASVDYNDVELRNCFVFCLEIALMICFFVDGTSVGGYDVFIGFCLCKKRYFWLRNCFNVCIT